MYKYILKGTGVHIQFFFCLLRSDPSMIYVSVGYGFFVEFTLTEALKFIEKKMAYLTERSDALTKDAVKIKTHIKLVLEVGVC